NALGLVTQGQGETEGDLKRKMIKIAQAVREANLRSENMQSDKNLWASLSKSKMERLRSSHAGKLKRMLMEIDPALRDHMDVEWNAGSLWLRGVLLGSATRGKPVGATIAEGKVPQAWVDLTTAGRVIGCSESDLRDRWSNLMDYCPERAGELQAQPLKFVSWNIGGKPVQDALTAIKVDERYTLVQFRDDLRQWRGNGILFDSDQFVCLRRKANHVGVWARLRHVATQVEVWVGSARLSTGVTDDITAGEVQELLASNPQLVVFMADFNTRMAWSRGGGRGCFRPTTGRADNLLAEIEGRGLQFCPPSEEQWDTPISRPRRAGAKGRQIDGVAISGAPLPCISIEERSYTQIGGDHDRVSLKLEIAGKGRGPQIIATGPRIVTGSLPSLGEVDQDVLMKLARDRTKPKPGTRYQDPPEVKQMYREAKRHGGEARWKAAHKARRQAHDQWQRDKLERASQRSWKDYKDLKQTQSGTTWAVHMSEEAFAAGKDPQQWTISHFKALFTDASGRALPSWSRGRPESNPFSMEELELAVQNGKKGKAVGMDLTSFELLKSLMQDDQTAKALLRWMEDIRQGRPIPPQWLQTIVTLLPKTPSPSGPGELRPISLGSAVGKVYGTMLLRRTRAAIQPIGPEQCSHSGRQTADYVYTAIRSFQLDTEWRWGLHWVKLDISKAFDSLDRVKALTHLQKALPENMHLEFESWRRLLMPGTAVIRTPWGEQSIGQTRGIRQGAVESPWLFSLAMELALSEAQAHAEWPSTIGAAPDLCITDLLFMDDSLLWSGSQRDLKKKYDILSGTLAEWGLMVNPKKTAYYASPHATEQGPLLLDKVAVKSRESLEVMGIALSVPLKPAGLMDAALAKARKKYFASRDMLECRTPLKERLKLFSSTVAGAALWYSAAAPPSPQGMGAVNSLQLELVARMAGFRRRSSETWLEYHTRSRRAARQILVNHQSPRWSTIWLQRYWGYKGHIARAARRTKPPASSLIDSFRTYPWWRQQQRMTTGLRHPASFYPYLSNDELRLNRAAAREDWRQLATDPQAWKQAEAEWIRRSLDHRPTVSPSMPMMTTFVMNMFMVLYTIEAGSRWTQEDQYDLANGEMQSCRVQSHEDHRDPLFYSTMTEGAYRISRPGRELNSQDNMHNRAMMKMHDGRGGLPDGDEGGSTVQAWKLTLDGQDRALIYESNRGTLPRQLETEAKRRDQLLNYERHRDLLFYPTKTEGAYQNTHPDYELNFRGTIQNQDVITAREM
ncbi:unnamed protein product, partial [Symbiodinium necroappetens]